MNNLTWAAVQMVAGLKVCRSIWNPGTYLSVHRRGIPYVYITNERSVVGVGERWDPMVEDLLATDWVLSND
jgi:hypothetical protein